MNTQVDHFELRAFGLSDTGCVRETNEDAFSISEQQGVFSVSDGMGGARAGALASAMTVQALPLQISKELSDRDTGAFDFAPAATADGVARSIVFVNNLLLDKTQNIPEVKGLCATVVVALYLKDGILTLAHLGDSRAYLLRQGYFERLTVDHTVAEMLYQTGRISRRELRRHPSRHVLTRHIGKEDCPAADIALLPLRPNDRILLCTDGLTGMLNDREIGTILWETEKIETACRLLIDRANEAGGHDNITVVIVDVNKPCKQYKRYRQNVIVRRTVGRSIMNVKETLQ